MFARCKHSREIIYIERQTNSLQLSPLLEISSRDSGLSPGFFRAISGFNLGSRQGYRKIPVVLRTQRPYWHGAWHVLRGRRDDMAIWARVTLNVLTPTLAHLRATIRSLKQSNGAKLCAHDRLTYSHRRS